MTSRSNENATSGQRIANRVRDLLSISIWFGLAAGLLEGILAWTFQQAGWVTWDELLASVNLNILWVNPIVNTLLLLSLGVVLLPALLFLSRRQVIATGIFASLAFYGCLNVSGRLDERGVIMLALGLGVLASRWMGADPERRMARLRRSLAPLAAICLLAGLGVVGGEYAWEKVRISRLPQAASNPPNVLLIVMDTARADRMGSYGYEKPTTPFLDEYAKQGVLFERAFSTSSWSLPAHASLFTGRLPFEHGAELWPYDGRYPTVGEMLSNQGYATAGFVANGDICTAGFGLARGFQHWENIFLNAVDSASRTSFGQSLLTLYGQFFVVPYKLREVDATEINRRFLRWLDDRPARPFFVFLNYMEAHTTMRPKPEFLKRFTTDPETLSAYRWFRKYPKSPLSAERLRQRSNERYDAEMAALDAQIQTLFLELKKRNLEENLLVIITSDHGQMLGERQHYGHQNTLYTPETQVPLIFRWPTRIPEGVRVARPVSIAAIPSTIFELIAAKNAFDSPLESLAQLWNSGEDRPDWPFPLMELAKRPTGRNQPPKFLSHFGALKAMVSPEWYYILHEKFGPELYDMQTDFQQSNNLAHTPEGQRISGEFEARLRAVQTRNAGTAQPPSPRDVK